MQCISLWNPWALLWLLEGEKTCETRHWPTRYRGQLLVHAAKKNDREIKDFIGSSGFRAALERHGLTAEALTFGAIIGQVDLIDCSRMDQLPEPSEREEMWGNWAPDRYAWKRGPNPVIFAKPIPYRGAQGFFSVPDALVCRQH